MIMTSAKQAQFVPLSYSTGFLFRNKRLFFLSTLFFAGTIGLTYLGYHFSLQLLLSLTGSFFSTAPDTVSITGKIFYVSWISGKYLYTIISHILSFYLSFLFTFIVTTPVYVFLSNATENCYRKLKGHEIRDAQFFSASSLLRDLWEGIKLGFFGLFITFLALLLNFVPVVGQLLILVTYIFYSALIFIDYPASKRGWSLRNKIRWVIVHHDISFRLGLLPALISMIPFLNIFLLALLFPLLTIHATLNFISILDENDSVKQVLP